MQIKIPFKTPTVNHLYFNWQGRTILSNQARKLKQEIVELVMEKVTQEEIEPLIDKMLNVKLSIHENWFGPNGNIARKDLGNREKFLIDSVFKGLAPLDDRQIFTLTMEKCQDYSEEFAVIEISL